VEPSILFVAEIIARSLPGAMRTRDFSDLGAADYSSDRQRQRRRRDVLKRDARGQVIAGGCRGEQTKQPFSCIRYFFITRTDAAFRTNGGGRVSPPAGVVRVDERAWGRVLCKAERAESRWRRGKRDNLG
jgi:hypothetical protein